jgi:hypothetical protein
LKILASFKSLPTEPVDLRLLVCTAFFIAGLQAEGGTKQLIEVEAARPFAWTRRLQALVLRLRKSCVLVVKLTSCPAALAELREFVEAGLGSDAEYCTELRRQSLRSIPLGLAMFFVAGGLFGLYCWYASWAPDPPPGHWIRWFGWLIHGILLVLLGAALAGPLVAYFFGLRQWLRVRRLERAVAMGGSRNAAPGTSTGR